VLTLNLPNPISALQTAIARLLGKAVGALRNVFSRADEPASELRQDAELPLAPPPAPPDELSEPPQTGIVPPMTEAPSGDMRAAPVETAPAALHAVEPESQSEPGFVEFAPEPEVSPAPETVPETEEAAPAAEATDIAEPTETTQPVAAPDPVPTAPLAQPPQVIVDPELEKLLERIATTEAKVVDLAARKAYMEQLLEEFAFRQYQVLLMFATNSSINQQVTLFYQITQLVVFKPISVKYQQSLGGRRIARRTVALAA
jgi:hypothetical protein